MENVLYYGDNLDILRRYVKDESVDLIYLDPPFKPPPKPPRQTTAASNFPCWATRSRNQWILFQHPLVRFEMRDVFLDAVAVGHAR